VETDRRLEEGLSRRDEFAVAFFGAWTVVGLHLDGWSHLHQRPETFFTVWHGLLYSGVLGGVLYFLAGGVRRAGAGRADKPMRAGSVVFVVGAVGDLIWHTIFGIEVSVRAFLSPTHLMLMTGGILMVTGPVRSAAARGPRPETFRSFLPTLVALTAAALIAGFFTQFITPFRTDILVADVDIEVSAIVSVSLMNAILVVLALYMVRRFVPPFGTHAFLFGAMAAGAQALLSFRQPAHVLAATVAGIVVDVVARRTGRSPLAVALATPLALWTLWLGAVAASGGVHWPAELPVGIVVLAALEGWGLFALTDTAGPVAGVSRPSPTGRT
jgi:hypothetical protein